MESEQTTSRRAANILTLVLACFAILTFPPLLGRIVSLEWQIGDLRSIALGLHAFFLLSVVITWLARRQIGNFLQSKLPQRRKLLFAVVALAISSLGTLAVVECGMRILKVPFTGGWVPSENALAKFDEDLGWSYIPDNTVTQEFGSDARSVSMHFDQIGSRVAEPTTQLDPLKPTVLFIGGSFTMGHGLDYEETLPGHLASMSEFPFQVVNLGVQGFGTDQSLLQLERHFDKFNTKIVVYTFINDHVRRNANYDRRLLFPKGRFLGTKPKFTLQNGGKPVLKKIPKRYEDLSFCWIWGTAQGAWVHWGPPPKPQLTKGLVRQMNDYAMSKGALLMVIDWDQDSDSSGEPSIFADLDLHLIDTQSNPPAQWNDWIIPGDTHPDAQATRHVAELVNRELQRLNVRAENQVLLAK